MPPAVSRFMDSAANFPRHLVLMSDEDPHPAFVFAEFSLDELAGQLK